jgi:hypothetical protein
MKVSEIYSLFVQALETERNARFTEGFLLFRGNDIVTSQIKLYL